jgi:hypothetical protein
MTDHSNFKGWVGLFLAACSGMFGLWQIRRGEAITEMGGRFKKKENPIAFWVIVGMFFGASAFLIGIAIAHWR